MHVQCSLLAGQAAGPGGAGAADRREPAAAAAALDVRDPDADADAGRAGHHLPAVRTRPRARHTRCALRPVPRVGTRPPAHEYESRGEESIARCALLLFARRNSLPPLTFTLTLTLILILIP